MIENADVVEKATGRSFLTAIVYANADVDLNDANDRDSLAVPALADVAGVIARHAFAVSPSS